MNHLYRVLHSGRNAWAVGGTVVVLLAVSGLLRAGGKDDPFSLAHQFQEDPFAPANQAKPEQAPAQVVKESPLTRKLAELATFKVSVEPPQAGPGSVVKLTIHGNLKPGFHTYPVTQRAPGQIQQSKINYSGSPELKPLWPVSESKPGFRKEGDGNYYLEHEHTFTWSQDILILPDAKPGAKTLRINLTLMVCDQTMCYGPAAYRPLEATIQVEEGPAIPLTPDLEKRLHAAPPEIQEVPVPAELLARQGEQEKTTSKAAKQNPTTKADDAMQQSLLSLLGAAFGGAFFMLLTPCVFPMIPITVNFFLKQSEKEHHNPLLMASVYSGTIIILLTLVVLVLGNVVITLAINEWFNLALGLVLIVFALSLFGMYELELPSGLARFTSSREGQGGYLGALFMALTFTITSFTCTGPFLGALLAPVAQFQPPLFHLILAALVYSTTFAAPFFVLALFPSTLKKLPKSGSWLNSVKVTMGFLELAAALKFLSNTDNALYPGNPRLFNFDTVLCAWIALSVAAGLYLMGIFRLPHDDEVEHIGVVRMLFAALFIGLAVYMTPALWGVRLQGVIGENIIAFLPPRLHTSPDTGQVAQGSASGAAAKGQPAMTWHLDYIDAWEQATKENKLIFIDFTGIYCTNCRYNEENIFPEPRVAEALGKYVGVKLYTDSVPNPKLSAAAAREQAERNGSWRDHLGDLTNPYYIVLRPNRDAALKEDGQLNGEVLGRTNGTIRDIDAFVRVLERPQQQVAQSARADVVLRVR